MRLTSLTDYALRVLIYTGSHNDRLCTIAEIAQVFGISQTHLMKVSQLLAQQGLIQTVRGKNGGLRLGRSPDLINLGSVVKAIEPDFTLVECMGAQSRCKLTGKCALTCILRGARNAFFHHLDCYTLADAINTAGTPSSIGSAPPRMLIHMSKEHHPSATYPATAE